jgi:RimJ/RimL family protein N-acetyltransferase
MHDQSTMNEWGQPLGTPIDNWQPLDYPRPQVLAGWGCRLEPLNCEQHGHELWLAFAQDSGAMWTYLNSGPFADETAFGHWLQTIQGQQAPLFYAIVDERHNRPLGLASYLRIDPAAGSIEVGWLHFSPALQRSRLATAAMVLMMEHAFSLGYRRYEWKCNALNRPSWQAALRLGFHYEGTFRQARVDKGHNRDTAWFSILDREWPLLLPCYQRWLADDNFDAQGQQGCRLSELTARAMSQQD